MERAHLLLHWVPASLWPARLGPGGFYAEEQLQALAAEVCAGAQRIYPALRRAHDAAPGPWFSQKQLWGPYVLPPSEHLIHFSTWGFVWWMGWWGRG